MRIQLLGSPAILVNGRRLEHPSKKAMALLAYLAMRADDHISRSHLAGLLWGDSGEDQARANLRQTLSQLRKLFQAAGADPILVPFDKIVLCSEGIEIDAKTVLSDLDRHSIQSLSDLQPFLEGLAVQAPEFESWLASQRRAIQSRLAEHLRSRAAAARAGGRHGEAAQALSLALGIDPLQEELHRALIEALAAQGRFEEALQQYEMCRAILHRELQIEPDVATRALASTIRSQRQVKSQPGSGAAAFNRYPPPSRTLLLVAEADRAARGHYFDDARSALARALEMQRSAADPAKVTIAVTSAAGDAAEREAEAAAILRETEQGTIAVAPVVFEQFRHWSPFTFGERRTLATGQVINCLLSEISRHRMQVLPTVLEPEAGSVTEFSVAVLPILDRSPAAGDDNLGDVLSEEIIHRLSRYRGLTVAAPSAGQSFRSLGHSLDRARRMLGVNYLVDGNILREGDRLQVHLTLTDLRDNRLVFSHKFDGSFPGLLFDQNELTDRIATLVFHRAEGAEMLRAQRAPTQDIGAYQWYLRGLSAHRRAGISPDNAKEAFDHFTRAIALDPRFARAIAWRLCAVSWFNREYLFDPGMQQIREALSIDEEDAEVHRIAGAVHLYQGDHEQGIRHIERAVELNPSDAYLLATSAIYWAYYGEPENGLKHMDRAMRLDPFLPAWCVEDHGILLYSLGDYSGAIVSLHKLASPSLRSLAYLAASQVENGQGEDAQGTVRKIRSLARDFSVDQLLANAYYRNARDRDRLRERLNKAGWA